jgi:hypothetical protein
MASAFRHNILSPVRSLHASLLTSNLSGSAAKYCRAFCRCAVLHCASLINGLAAFAGLQVLGFAVRSHQFPLKVLALPRLIPRKVFEDHPDTRFKARFRMPSEFRHQRDARSLRERRPPAAIDTISPRKPASCRSSPPVRESKCLWLCRGWQRGRSAAGRGETLVGSIMRAARMCVAMEEPAAWMRFPTPHRCSARCVEICVPARPTRAILQVIVVPGPKVESASPQDNKAHCRDCRTSTSRCRRSWPPHRGGWSARASQNRYSSS